ncbi:hypothetical protein SAMN05421786_104115 [Chryseobacterium ureilyticum]|uniref:Uncharacterized protein n=1 Tax=Chryseobacterium ureilyticum TaxID=373668 RepID=A0A1N7NW45_9FLAO|nr:hypothetical protein [Chryseobacterium ureilyticum]SIT02530.1 hypothetical protein SAMN05421786_104115 [Chryseobacterium ureilyticum]
MRFTILITAVFVLNQSIKGQQSVSQDSISVFFDELKTAAHANTELWSKDLYGPTILINPESRTFFANEQDDVGSLQPNGNIYSGVLPGKINIANTAIDWNGKKWAMIMLPLSQNKHNRINLLAHESFHRIQPSLGFTSKNSDNNHLDQKEGRIYLRLELEALKKAIQSRSEKEKHEHLTNALTFRKYRHQLYENSDSSENQLELNEGLAEFTGVIISNRNKAEVSAFFQNEINEFFKNPTFVRSFAYYTIPVYGYLLYDKDKNWNKAISVSTDLTDYFIKAFNISIPRDLKKAVQVVSAVYNGKKIQKEEAEREERTKKLIAEYKLKLITQPHFEIKFEKMNISFDPRNIVPVEDKGTVYPNIRVTDRWGILTVDKGAALMSPNWDKISISNPVKTEGKKISGEGWILELTDGYTVGKDDVTGNYKLIKN